ncbi:amidohydrolase family protein [Sporosarcina saromensis]|uniref:Amidohydrolase family protein n=1 Tax=Sporosarcina saromensis TaxID=359365 RepID=A0ABU4G7Z0_9BACL|nr:amidohydrolase family protein [Sporosarcina saromensis]MDW0113098.1 amidohydrolase family protein [Sporosarcina saromensis]
MSQREEIISGLTLLVGEDFDEVHGCAIWVKNGEIHAILPENELPEGVPVIQFEGGYLFPGLIDLHVHLIWSGGKDPVGDLEKESIEQTIIRSVANCHQQVYNGVTTVRDLGSVDDIALELADAVESSVISGPRIIASGKTITMTGGHDPFWARFADGPIEALKATREQIYKNAQVIKVSATGGVYGRSKGELAENAELNLEELTVICSEAHRFGLQVASHAIGREGIENSIKAGVNTIEHGHYLDDPLIDLMIDREVAWIPTLYVYQVIAQADGIPAYAHEKAKRITEIHQSAFKRYFKSGVLIGAGSDAGSCDTPHPSVIEEITLMADLTGEIKESLKTATVHAGKILKMNVGQIREGFKADFIVLENNPAEDIHWLRDVQAVYVEGVRVR